MLLAAYLAVPDPSAAAAVAVGLALASACQAAERVCLETGSPELHQQSSAVHPRYAACKDRL